MERAHGEGVVMEIISDNEFLVFRKKKVAIFDRKRPLGLCDYVDAAPKIDDIGFLAWRFQKKELALIKFNQINYENIQKRKQGSIQ
jgi:hypothetical protein